MKNTPQKTYHKYLFILEHETHPHETQYIIINDKYIYELLGQFIDIINDKHRKNIYTEMKNQKLLTMHSFDTADSISLSEWHTIFKELIEFETDDIKKLIHKTKDEHWNIIENSTGYYA